MSESFFNCVCMKLVLLWLVSAAFILMATYFLPWATVDGFGTALLVAFVLGIVNVTIRPLIWLLTLPLNILTLGLLSFVINAAMVLLVDNWVDGFEAGNFWTALIISLSVSLASVLVNDLQKK